MGGTGVIDRFLGVFTQYIDSGFGLVQGDVRWLAGVLIAIDITLAGLFWALAPDEDVIARLRAPSRLWARAIAAMTAVRSASCVV